MKGLLAWVYEAKSTTNCSNGGISSRVNKVTLVGPGIPEIFEPKADAPAVWLRKRGNWVHAIPEEPGKETVWWMMGGCYICSSDSRFPSDYPIPLHDRTESAEMSRILSM